MSVPKKSKFYKIPFSLGMLTIGAIGACSFPPSAKNVATKELANAESELKPLASVVPPASQKSARAPASAQKSSSHKSHSAQTSDLSESIGNEVTYAEISEQLQKKVNVLDFPQNTRAPASASKSGEPLCSSVEYLGDGSLGDADWRHVQNVFDDSKSAVFGWLAKNHARFSPAQWSAMHAQLSSVILEHPSTKIDSDLAMRGIGILGQAHSSAARPLKLGEGFVKLLVLDPDRAKFELTRLITQSWSTCEGKKVAAESPWTAYLNCMDVVGDFGCGENEFSESGWAISSAVASLVSHPGCRIPAFDDRAHAQCIEKTLFPEKSKNQTVASQP